MAKLLHIQASPMRERSYSIQVARSFIDGYRETHPDDEVETLDLWEADLPKFDFTTASGKYKVLHGLPHSEEEARAWKVVTEVIDHFKSAEGVLISSPMWNFGVPYPLKHYIDILVQPGLTFSYDPATGFSGLVTHRPVQFILARSAEYPQGTETAAMDYQRPYLEFISRFIGFSDIRTILVEPTMAGGPAVAEEKLQEAMTKAWEAGRSFRIRGFREAA